MNPIANLSIDALWDASVDGLLLVDQTGTITATNPSLDSLFGYPRGALVGESIESLVPSAQRGLHVRHRREFERDRRSRPMAARNLEGLRRDGTTFAVNVSLAPVATDNGAMTFAAVRDLTERAAHEKALSEAQRRRIIAEDHDRIAKDLHDSVIQRLFALGLGLQGVPHRVEDAELADRVSSAVDSLDEIIRDIRTTIYGLREPHAPKQGLRPIIVGLARESEPSLGFVPDVSMSGSLDRVTDDTLIGNIVSVVREALSNAGRHANASTVSISVSVQEDLVVEVSDDGDGMDIHNGRRSGLANMENRAAAYRGSFEIVAGEMGGTTIRWSVPGDQIV